MKITINCGSCGNHKGCQVKKKFRDVSESIDIESYNPLRLKCPLKTPRYKEKTKVKFTVGYGSHKGTTEWECDWDKESCDGCVNELNCHGGIVKFQNIKYKGYTEFEGEIYSHIKNGRFYIAVKRDDFNEKKELFNDRDLKILNDIHDTVDVQKDIIWDDFFSFDNLTTKCEIKNNYMFFVSNSKYIKPIK